MGRSVLFGYHGVVGASSSREQRGRGRKVPKEEWDESFDGTRIERGEDHSTCCRVDHDLMTNNNKKFRNEMGRDKERGRDRSPASPERPQPSLTTFYHHVALSNQNLSTSLSYEQFVGPRR
jgi:hypothetical protein